MSGRKNSVFSPMSILNQHKLAERFFGKGRTAMFRFIPDGDDGDGSTGDGDDDAKKKADDEKKKEFDAERQRADQEAANARKAKEESEALKTANAATKVAYANLQAEKEKLESDLIAAKASAAADSTPKINIDDMEGNEKVLAQGIKGLQDQIKANAEKSARLIKEQQAKITQYEQNEAAKAKAVRDKAQYNELLDELDSEYGAECRNKAVAAYTEKYNNGDVQKDNAAKAMRVLEGCYKAAQKEAKDKGGKGDKGGFNPDPGTGGGRSGATVTSLNTKQGDRSLAEVTAEAKGAIT